MTNRSEAYWVLAPGRGGIRTQTLAAESSGWVRGVTLASGISPGTERLVGLGAVPPECHDTMACAYMEGSFSLPAKYGYSLVARLNDGQRVFLMHPHQTEIIVERARLLPLPEDLGSERATLFPCLETALNAVWDADPQSSELCAVVGGGLIGILISYVLHRQGRGRPRLFEGDSQRRDKLRALPWLDVAAPEPDAAQFADCVFHCSGSPSGLQWSIDALRFEGRVVEVSWYGKREVRLKLGGSFHYGRKRIVSSQVGAVAAPVRDAISFRERHEQVLALLLDPELDRLLEPRVPFSTLPDFMHQLYKGDNKGYAPVVTYD
ncbi:MAG: zinc-binding alcohol dehydrogenase [Pseudomonadota bacterium]